MLVRGRVAKGVALCDSVGQLFLHQAVDRRAHVDDALRVEGGLGGGEEMEEKQAILFYSVYSVIQSILSVKRRYISTHSYDHLHTHTHTQGNARV